MAENKVVMSWSKVRAFIGRTADSQEMCAEAGLFCPGYINDKSTSLSSEDGETLTAKASGGVTIAEEKGEPTLSVTYRIKEMTFETEQKLIGGVIDDETGSFKITSNVVDAEYSLVLIPKNVGGIGICARRTSVSYVPGYSEEEGHYVDITHKILACSDGELYKKFRVTTEQLAWAKAHSNY